MARPLIDLPIAELIQKYQDNMSLNELAKYYEVSTSTIRRSILRHDPNFSFRPLQSGGGRRKLRVCIEGEKYERRREQVIQMYFDEGINMYDIHCETGFSLMDIEAVIRMKLYEQFTPADWVYGNPFNKTRTYSKCVWCETPLPPGSRRMTCSDRCLKSHRQEQFKQKVLAALK